ncbi:hypothetical protein HGA34_00205 [Candidatus Falkowbacteria bacterium]|nr:hypothetical protein [Candidatus Falkowbacteria bacterium]
METIPTSRKKALVIGLAALLIAGTAFGYWRYRQVQEDRSQVAAAEEAARLAKKQAEEKIQKEVSVGYAIISQAVKSKSPDDCLQLEKSVLDSCLYSVAQVTSDKKICERILDFNKRTVCQEFLVFREGTKKISNEFCAAFKSSEVAESCFSQIFSGLSDIKSCEPFAEPNKQRCLDLVNSKLAITGDGTGCDSVKDKDIKSSCRMASASAPKDSDKDGISDTTEIGYGTNPFKADTDGDGLKDGEEMEKYLTSPVKADTDGDKHSDGEEVGGGFNPLGEGKLKK